MPTTLLQNRYERLRAKAEALYEAYGLRLTRFACAFLRDEALGEEAVQQAFLLLLHDPKKLERSTEEELKRWLYVSVRYEAIKLWRIRQKETPMDEATLTGLIDDLAEADLAEAFEIDDERTLLKDLLEGVSTTSREILWLKYGKNLSNGEIAEHLGISYEAVATRLSRARKELKAKI